MNKDDRIVISNQPEWATCTPEQNELNKSSKPDVGRRGVVTAIFDQFVSILEDGAPAQLIVLEANLTLETEWDELHPPVKMPKCEVCKINEAIGVCCVPGVPMNCAYCQSCLEKNSHPMGIVVAQTAMAESYDKCAPWWQELVQASLKAQNKTMEWFLEEVKRVNEELNSIGKAEDRPENS